MNSFSFLKVFVVKMEKNRVMKRKHITLSLADKCTILKRLDKGESGTQLAKEFNVGKSTISDIRTNRENILSFVSICEEEPNKRQTLKLSDYPLLDSALYQWFLQERSRHTPISGPILKEKAMVFHNKIHPEASDFKASDGWLTKFKKRHGIRKLSVTGEKLSSDTEAVEPFKKKFLSKIEELGLIHEQIYNADESGLFWRLLPEKTFVHKYETTAPGRKLSKERVTFMPCANVTGNHKLRMMVIGKSQNPRAFKNCSLPVYYKGQSKAWMNVALFKEWFFGEFVPSVRKHLKSVNVEQKALLLIDNCSGHPDEDELVSDDGCITTIFLPPNCTALIQPMDQNVIQATKLQYKKSLLSHVVAQDSDIISILKKLNLKDVVFYLTAAWDSVKPQLIRTSWNKILGKESTQEENTEVIDEASQATIRDLVRIIRPEAEISESEIVEWVEGREENEIAVKTDDEIVQETLNDPDIDEEENETTQVARAVKHEDAVTHFNQCINWAMENNTPWQQIILLQCLREEAVKKLFEKAKQKQITDYFQK